MLVPYSMCVIPQVICQIVVRSSLRTTFYHEGNQLLYKIDVEEPDAEFHRLLQKGIDGDERN